VRWRSDCGQPASAATRWYCVNGRREPRRAPTSAARPAREARADQASRFPDSAALDRYQAAVRWALGLALLALVAGVTGDLGNRVTAILGVVGGVSFAAAAVTIPFTDTLDGLFPVGGMAITLLALGVAPVGAWRRRQTDLQPA
jgi:hypothetical protein